MLMTERWYCQNVDNTLAMMPDVSTARKFLYTLNDPHDDKSSFFHCILVARSNKAIQISLTLFSSIEDT